MLALDSSANLYVGVFVVATIANLILLVWFVITMNHIKRYVALIADYTRRSAISQALSTEQVRVINRDLSPQEILAKLRESGARVTLVTFAKDLEHWPDTIKIENAGRTDPEILQMANEQLERIAEYLESSKKP